MKSKLLASLLFISLLFNFTSLADAAVKTGSACKKVGQTSVVKGKTFTCIKSGKKKVWNKGVPVKTASPIQSPTPTPTPSRAASPAPTPIPAQPSIPKEPKNLEEIASFDQISYWAWKKSADKINRSENFTKGVEILIGPNSSILNKNPLEATIVTSRLFAGFNQPEKLTFISYSFADVSWAQAKIEELLDDSKLLEILQAPNRGGKDNALATCPSVERCHSSQPFTNRAGKSIVIAGFTPSRLNNEGETQGELQSHEFAHVIQQHQFIGTERELLGLASLKQFVPWWLVEGGADFVGFASKNYNSYENYSKARMRDVLRVPKKDSEWYQEFINPPDNQYWVPLNATGEIYNVGFMVTEILSAVKGPDIQMQIIKSIANGKSMDEAFETEFGIPWAKAVPIIARLIADERAKY